MTSPFSSLPLSGSGGWTLKRISFVKAQKPDAHSTNPADLGLIPLNDPVEPAGGSMHRPQGRGAIKGGKQASKELFSEADVVLRWTNIRKTGAGLQNLGNTCFMNSVLQCLTHTPPLAELFLSGRALRSGGSNGFDPLGVTRELVQRSLQHRGPIVSPVAHARNLRRVCRSFRLGRQEDAHEYLVALLDAIHEASIAGLQPKPAPELAQTSFIYRIFAGKIRSQVKCSQCGYESNTYDPFLDLSLEIMRANTVERALEHFTKGEVLDGANKYRCSKEAKPVRAVKRISIHSAPNVLVLQLKRFEFSLSGHKISKKVDFGTTLDLSPYMSKRPAVPAEYELYGVLVHSGHSVHSGHYYCFVRSGNGMWHICDDAHVQQVSERVVLGQKAYILFYIKKAPHRSHRLPISPPSAAKQAGNPFQQRQQEAGAASGQKQQQQQQRLQPSPAKPAGLAAAAAGGRPLQENRPPAQQQQQPGGKRKLQLEPAAGPSAPAAKRPKGAAGAAAAAAGPSQREQQAAEAAAAAQAAAAAARVASQPPAQRVANGGVEHLASPALTRMRLIARQGSVLTPGSRREQRLAETSSLHRSLAAAMHRRQAAAGYQQAYSPPRSRSPSPPPAAAAAVGGKKGSKRGARVAAAAAAAATDAGSCGAASSPSTSTVVVPDWPPQKQEGGGRSEQQQQQQQQQPAAASAAVSPAPFKGSGKGGGGGGGKGSSAKGADLQRFLQQQAGGRVGLAVEQWDSVDLDTKRQRDRLLHKAGPKRKQPDEYDAEYDRGKLKKVRNKGGEDEERGVGSASFDAAVQAKQRGGGGGSAGGGSAGGGSNPVQLRGKKLKRQREQQQQRGRGGGRGGQGGGRGKGRGKGPAQWRQRD